MLSPFLATESQVLGKGSHITCMDVVGDLVTAFQNLINICNFVNLSCAWTTFSYSLDQYLKM